MTVAQCDWCKSTIPIIHGMPPNWIMIATIDPDAKPGLFSSGTKPEAMLCTWVCLAEWAAAKALLKEASE